jgi:hypothetical protein
VFIQYEVWGSIDGHDSLIDTVSTLKEARVILEDNRVLHDELWICEDVDGEVTEIERTVGL